MGYKRYKLIKEWGGFDVDDILDVQLDETMLQILVDLKIVKENKLWLLEFKDRKGFTKTLFATEPTRYHEFAAPDRVKMKLVTPNSESEILEYKKTIFELVFQDGANMVAHYEEV